MKRVLLPVPRPAPQPAVGRLSAAAAAAIVIALTLVFVCTALANRWPGPYVDYWIDIPNVQKAFDGTLTLRDLVSAHANVHRLFIPRLLFIADYRWFGGTNALLVAASFACKLAMLGLCWHLLRREAPALRLWLGVLAAAATLNLANVANVLHHSNMQWDLVSVFCCFSLYFYCRDLDRPTRERGASLALALAFFAAGFLSQGGALPLPLVCVALALLHRRWGEAALGLAFAALVFWLTFSVLPVNEPEKPTYESALVIFILKLRYVARYVFRMFSGSFYWVDSTAFAFSWLALALLVANVLLARRTQNAAFRVLLAFALFALAMMVTIAAARVDFAPNTWAANRYQTNVMLFLFALFAGTALALPDWLGASGQRFRPAFLAFAFASFGVGEYCLAGYPFVFGNKVFAAEAYLLAHGATQQNGADLLPSLQSYDRIANADPFFREHGVAWYHNKQAARGAHRAFVAPGHALATPDELARLAQTCPEGPETPAFATVPGAEGWQFDAGRGDGLAQAVVPWPHDTWYVLDANGVVTGFGWLFLDPDRAGLRTRWRGYTVTPAARYLVDVTADGALRCLVQWREAAP